MHTKGTKICKVLQLRNLELPPVAHFLMIFASFRKTYNFLQSFFKCGSRVVHNNGAKLSRGGHSISEKVGLEAAASLSFLNIYP